MLLTLLAFVIVLGVLIFVHELGHFVAAKRSKVRVEVFSMGFGPRLLTVTRGETDYVLSAIPFGGFIKMAGENPEQEPEGHPWEFLAKTKKTRALIVVAGPAMNFVLAIVIFTFLIYTVGVGVTNTRVIGAVEANSAASAAGLREGDTVLSVGGIEVKTWDEMLEIIAGNLGKRVVIAVERGGSPVNAELDLSQVKDYSGLGMSPFDQAILDFAKIGGPAYRAGLRGGDKIIAINGVPITNWRDIRAVVEPSADKPLRIAWERNGVRDSATVTPRKETGVGRIDVSYRFDKRRIGLLESLVMGSRQTMLVSREIFNFFPKLLSGRVSSDEVGGPVRIGQIAGETFRWGWSVFLSFIAVMSAQLGLINLLPIPILDGGHILILGVETAIRKPINVRQRIVAQQIGFALLVAVMVGLTFKDIVRVLVK